MIKSLLYRSNPDLQRTDSAAALKEKNQKSLMLAMFFILAAIFGNPQNLLAQTTTISTETGTNFTANNSLSGNSFITFVIENTNTYDIILTKVDQYWDPVNTGTVPTLWYSTTSLAGLPTVSTPAWTSIVTAPAVTVTTAGYYTTIPNLNFTIPAGAKYRFAVQSSIGVRYSGTGSAPIPTPSVLTSNGVNLKVYDATVTGSTGVVGYSGAFPTGSNNPRAFTGRIHFQPALPCTAPPTAGQATSSSSIVCPNTPFQLSLTGASGGMGMTYQWQSSANGTSGWTNVASATNATVTTSQTATTYYRARLTCSGQTATSASVQVTTNNTPVTGTFTINKNGTPSATTFTSFASALASMDCAGVGGPVVFNVVANSGPYLETVTIPAINGASATNTITINGNGNTLRANSATADAVLKLDGAKFIRINNLIMETEPTATANACVRLVNNANNNIISNSTIAHNTTSTSTSYALYVYSGSSNNTFQNNQIIGGYYGVYNYGSTTAPVNNNQFIGNTVKEQYTYVMYNYYATNTRIEGNNLTRPTRTSVGSFYGIYLSTGSTGSIVTKNRIHNTHGAATSLTGQVYAIYVTGADATAGTENVFSNNLIYDINNTGTIYGIYSTSSDGSHFFHNTIDLSNTANTSIVRGFYQLTAATNVKFINNIVTVNGGTTGVKHALYFGTTTSAITSNNNVLYQTGGASGSGIGYFSANAPTLVAWKAVNSGAYDQASVSADPQYANVATGDLTPTNPAINNMGQGGTGVTTDINGLPRNATAPDPGAYEFLNNPTDVGVTAITSPTSVCGLTNQEIVTVEVTNFGTNAKSNIPVTYTLNGNPITGIVAGPLAAGATTTFSFPTKANLSASGAYTIVACTNLTGDMLATNNCTTKQVSNSSFSTLPITLNFETPATGSGTLRSVTRTNSAISEGTAASQGTGSTKGLIMEGVTNAGWILPAGTTDPWSVNQNNFSAVYLCFSPGSNTTDPLLLSFDLKQLFKTANANTNFRVTVNGNQIGTTYRPPFSGTPINWQHIVINLNAFRGQPSVEIGLESSVAEGYANGAGTANLIDNVRIERILGVNSDILNSQLNVFPNPSAGVFNVSLPQGKAFAMEVTDLTGRVVMKETSAAKNAQVDLSKAAKGIYLLKVTSEGSVVVRKLIVE
jgi:hypothetical protein